MTDAPNVSSAVVFYHALIAARDSTRPGHGFAGVGAGPYAALVTRVHPNGEVDLTVFPPGAEPFQEIAVRRDTWPNRFWRWPSEAAPEKPPEYLWDRPRAGTASIL